MNTLIRNLVCFGAAIGTAALATAVIALASSPSDEVSADAGALSLPAQQAAPDVTTGGDAGR